MTPVFYHVPKNAGTYMINNMLLFFREYRRTRTDWLERPWETARNIEIKHDGKTLMRLIAADPDNWCAHNLKSDPHDNSHYTANEQQAVDIINNIWMFAVVVEDIGFEHRDRLTGVLNINLYESVILREPFSRAKSLYGYITSEASAHEPYHKNITGSFEQYITSDQLECGWVIKSFRGLHDNTQPTTQHYDQTCELLDGMRVTDIKHTDQLIDQMFEECYDLSRSTFPDHFESNLHRNATPNKIKIEFNELDDQTQQTFLDRTYWDRKLYERYCED